MSKPSARLCHLYKWPDFSGYGFHLDAIKGKSGQYIGLIDENSPASLSGLQPNDKVIEVNGEYIGLNTHQEVVQKIKSKPNEVTLLVVSKEDEQWFQQEGIVVSSSIPHVLASSTPINNPFTTNSLNKESNSSVSSNGKVAHHSGSINVTPSSTNLSSPTPVTANVPPSSQNTRLGAIPAKAANEKADSLNLNLSAQEMRDRLSKTSKRRQGPQNTALSFGDKASLFHQL